MQIEPRDFSSEISNLEKLITNIQSNVFFTIGTLIAIIALGIALGGWALKVLARKWVDEKVEQEITKIRNDYEKLKQELDSVILKKIEDNPQFTYISGDVNNPIPIEGAILLRVSIKDLNVTMDFPNSVELTDENGRRVDYKLETNKKEDKNETEFTIYGLNGYDKKITGDKLKYKVMWAKEKYKNVTIKLNDN